MKLKEKTRKLTIAVLLTCCASASLANTGEWGDAPEGALAYPSTGVVGMFPTCANVPLAGFIWHGPLGWASFGPSFDFESEGNAGLCSSFTPYDADECFADSDAGLIQPAAWTIMGANVVPCQDAGGFLGPACSVGTWGSTPTDAVDIFVINNMPVNGYLNVLMDWNQDGKWGGSSSCGGGSFALEHVLQNFLVPMGFAGPVSLLAPPSFTIGPNGGFVWTRFSITEQPVITDWDGNGTFEDGETEDYLLAVMDATATEETSWSTLKSLYR